MKLTIIYDNEASRPDMTADWGFSCLIEAHGKTILFDTGGDGEILLNNMEVMAIDPLSVDEVFISHCHFDHIGGLSGFLNKNPNVILHAPESFRGVKHAAEVIYHKRAEKIGEGFCTTGELEGIEQSLIVSTEKGNVLIVGCSHPEMKNILNAAECFGEVNGIIGGLHGFNDFELLSDMELICPTHCTQHKAELRKLYPEKIVEGGAGIVIEV
jgi:7,8-dihydropterin-6-yl-methyl-4-(beta-D-ribofuranosyl)aminobenzene 5'-phosphate synthase